MTNNRTLTSLTYTDNYIAYCRYMFEKVKTTI
jgi:hypothetical protein